MTNVLQSEVNLLPSIIAMRPMVMLTGFLGAGKTTVLREVLDDLVADNLLCDVILNDRENADIDRETLRDHVESVAALTGSCVCCEGMDELYDMVMKVSKSDNHALLVELNGTADPLPLLEGFTLLESKFMLHPRWQVCVIDARHFGKRSRFSGLERMQLETASHYVLSHISQLSRDEEFELEEIVQAFNPMASRTSSFAIAQLLRQAIGKNRRHCLAESQKESDAGNWGDFASQFAHAESHHDRHHLAHEFTGCNIVIPEAVSEEQVLEWLKKLPESIIRAKALVTLKSDLKIRYLYERVGLEISPRAIPVRSVSQAPCSGLFIGADLEPEAILEMTRRSLHLDCHFPTK